MTRSSNRRRWIYAMLFFMAMINYIDRVNLSVASKPIAAAFHLSPVALGYLFSSFSWTYLLFLVPLGMLADRWGTRLTSAASIVFWSVASMLSGGATSFTTLLATRLALGIGESSTFPTGLRVLREWAPSSERGAATATFNAGSYAGPAFGAIFVAWLIGLTGWRGSFVVTGLLGFVWVVVWLMFFRQPEDARWITAAERTKILTERNNDGPANANAASGGSIGMLLRCRSTWGIALTQGCAVYTQYLFLTWLPNYLETAKGLTILKSGLFTALPYAISVVLAIALGRVSDRLLDTKSLSAGTRRNFVVGCLLASSVVLFTPFVDSIWAVVALVTTSLTFLSTGISMNFALTNDLLRTPAAAGKTFAIVVFGGNIFGLLAPIVTGYVIAGTGSFTWAFVVAGLLLVAGAAFSLTMTRHPITAGDALLLERTVPA